MTRRLPGPPHWCHTRRPQLPYQDDTSPGTSALPPPPPPQAHSSGSSAPPEGADIIAVGCASMGGGVAPTACSPPRVLPIAATPPITACDRPPWQHPTHPDPPAPHHLTHRPRAPAVGRRCASSTPATRCSARRLQRRTPGTLRSRRPSTARSGAPRPAFAARTRQRETRQRRAALCAVLACVESARLAAQYAPTHLCLPAQTGCLLHAALVTGTPAGRPATWAARTAAAPSAPPATALSALARRRRARSMSSAARRPAQ